MQKQIIASILPLLLLAQAAWAEPKSEIVRITPPPLGAQQNAPSAQKQNALPEKMRDELEQAAVLVQQHQSERAMPILDKLIKQAEAELKKHKNARAANHPAHALLLSGEAKKNRQTIEILPVEWLMPRYVRAFVYVEQQNYDAAAKDLDAILKIAPYEPQFLRSIAA